VADLEFQILQGFTYSLFPFDHHTVRMEFRVEGANLFTCRGRDALAIMGITSDNAQAKLLPRELTWILDGPLDEAVLLSHPINSETEYACSTHDRVCMYTTARDRVHACTPPSLHVYNSARQSACMYPTESACTQQRGGVFVQRGDGVTAALWTRSEPILETCIVEVRIRRNW